MIKLTRISGSVFVLNADLIERIDSTPDTVISLVDGKKYVVAESPEQVVAAIRRLRSDILSQSMRPPSSDGDDRASDRDTAPPLRLAAVSPLHGDC